MRLNKVVRDRHHDVEQNQVRDVARDLLHGLLTVAGAHRVIAVACSFLFEVIQVERLVIHDENIGALSHRPPLRRLKIDAGVPYRFKNCSVSR